MTAVFAIVVSDQLTHPLQTAVAVGSPGPTSSAVAATLQPRPPSTSAEDRRRAIKSMLYQAAQRHGVNPGLVLGLAWWESGWDQSQVSSTGAVGVMQIEPYTADTAGPRLLHQAVDIHQTAANIDLGVAILRENLDRYQNDLMKALVAYYAGPSAVTDWAHMNEDARRYVVGIHALAVSFDNGLGPA